MQASQQFSITLPHEIASVVEEKISSGAYASVSDLMREGVQSLIERDAALDRWLREEVTAGHAAYLAAPSSAITADELRQQLAHDIASSS